MSLSEPVENELRITFAGPLHTAAREHLPTSSDLPSEAPLDRVQIAVIRLAGGDIDALAHYSGRAKGDWRDVLYWADHPREENEPKSDEELRRRLGLTDD
jgi:hypothetical protein